MAGAFLARRSIEPRDFDKRSSPESPFSLHLTECGDLGFWENATCASSSATRSRVSYRITLLAALTASIVGSFSGGVAKPATLSGT